MQQSPSGFPAPPPASSHKSTLRHILAAPSPPPDPVFIHEKPPTPDHGPRRSNRDANPQANKITWLKKEDGEPFWRGDIQYNLLRRIFDDEHRVFTKYSDRTQGHTFSEVYIDAMARSTKSSNLLKEKLLSETSDPTVIPAKDMAMVCLLVNTGRMNTTVNFFPEMKARVRTFHSIPCLQEKQGPSASKQLQDGPRLKSILKGCQEDTVQPITLHELVHSSKPRINPVSMVFLLFQFAPKISDSHFPQPYELFDLFLKSNLSSESRARAFLWLMWWYLESNFTMEDAETNPFGRGRPGTDPRESVLIPEFQEITEEEAANENLDPPNEVDFGNQKRKEREENLAADDPPSTGKRGPAKAVDKSSNMRIEPREGSPLGDHMTSEPGQADLTVPPPDVRPASSDGNRSPLLAPAPRFTAANLPPPSQSRSRKRSSSPPAPASRDSIRPKLRPNMSQQSNDSVASMQGQAPDHTPHENHVHDGNQFLGHDAIPLPRTQGRDALRSPLLDSQLPPPPPLAPHRTQTPPVSQIPPQYYPQYPQSGSPYAPDYHYSNGMMITRNRGIVPPPRLHSDGRLPSNHPLHSTAVDVPRGEKVGRIVQNNFRALRKAKKRERMTRGVIADAWIKARSLPSGWDSEEDEFHRIGGIHDIRTEGGLSVNIKVGEAAESRRWDIGDAGAQASEIASLCRDVGQTLTMLDRRRMNLRKKPGPSNERRGRHQSQQRSRVLEARQGSSFPEPPPEAHHLYQGPVLQPAPSPPRPSVSYGGHESSTYSTSAFPRAPTPPIADPARPATNRRRKSSAAAPNEFPPPPGPQHLNIDTSNMTPVPGIGSADKVYTWTPKGRKRKDSEGVAPPGTRPGEIGWHLKDWSDVKDDNIVIDTAGTGGKKRRGTLTRPEGVQLSEDGAVPARGGQEVDQPLNEQKVDVEMDG